MPLDLDRTRANVQAATTEDLLDRATIYRDGMEQEALALIDEELRRRGTSPEKTAAHEAQRRRDVLWGEDGLPVKCSRCPRPAVQRGWGWHRLFGLLPVFPRPVALCAEHRPKGEPKATHFPASN